MMIKDNTKENYFKAEQYYRTKLIYEYNKGVLIDTRVMKNSNQEFINHK